MADIASIIGAGSQAVGAIGSLLGARKDKKAAEASSLASWQRNYEAQKEFAQNSIQWRVQDAKAAGINPYAAIGGQAAGYTPQDTSYQTNYQQGVARAMNGVADAMGQLQMAAVAEDVKGKKLDNDKKVLDLLNKATAARLGNTSETLKQPWFATYTPPVGEVDKFKLRTQTDGSQVLTSNADDIDLWNIQNIRDMMDAVFGIKGYDDIRAANKGEGKVGLTALGNAYFPQGVPVSKANIRAAQIQRDYGTLAGYLSIFPNHLVEAYENVMAKGDAKRRRAGKPKNVLKTKRQPWHR